MSVIKTKRGKLAQVSIFIILGVLILGIIIVFFLVNGSRINKRASIDEKNINDFVLRCVEEVSNDAVEHIGETGGYFTSPELSNSQKIAYYFYNKENKMPSKEKIEEEFGKYVDEMLFFCTKNFAEFSDYGVSQGEIKTRAKIEDNWVVFNIGYPLSVKKGDNSFFLENFNVKVPVRLGIIYRVISDIMVGQMKEKELICSSCVGKLAEENDLFIFLLSGEEGITFFIVDKNSEINEGAYGFKFVNKYG